MQNDMETASSEWAADKASAAKARAQGRKIQRNQDRSRRRELLQIQMQRGYRVSKVVKHAAKTEIFE